MLQHLACIMDGNRRWAKQRGWLPWDGHRAGLNAAVRVIDYCLAKNIPYLSLYTFSLENFKRPEQELNFLFNVLIQEMKKNLIDDFVQKGVAIRFIGDRTAFPTSVLPSCIELEEGTKGGKRLIVNLLFCYGGRQEIISAIKKLIHKVKIGEIDENAITDDLFEHYLWTEGTPAPDLIIRTGGVKRLSNFLLFQAAYSELCFIDCLWPDISDNDLNKAMETFTQCQRNFGV